MYEQHWRYMKRIVELNDGGRVYARYNTNLSRVDYRGINLYRDILAHIRDWQICASLDGTGAIGEYIRTGLNYSSWLDNFRKGLEITSNRRQMRIDFTLTLPGMFEIENIARLAQELEVDVLAKVVFSFSPNIIMSPLALPKEILHPWIDELLTKITNPALVDLLSQLKTRPTFQESWPDNYRTPLAEGKRRVLQLESIRGGIQLEDICRFRKEVYAWYRSIPS
jgi:hypothetical protein